MVEVLNVGLGVIAGLVWAAIGYAVARSKGADFESRNFGTTLIIGFVLGLLALATDVDIATLEGYSVLQLLTILVDKLIGLLEKPKS